jgi:hypothetical protein
MELGSWELGICFQKVFSVRKIGKKKKRNDRFSGRFKGGMCHRHKKVALFGN